MSTKNSIILCTYNEANYIEKTISELEKNIPNLELVIVDDNSTDGTIDIINKLNQNNKYKTVFRKKSRSLASAFVRGITEKFTASPVMDETATYYRQINRFSAAFALLTDISMVVIGGSLKRKETISARLGDVLSSLYLASVSLKYYEDTGDKESELPLVHWTQKTLLLVI